MMKHLGSKCFKKEFRYSNFGFDHDQVDSIVRSQWQSRSQSTIYLLYRWIVAIIVTYTVFTSLYHHLKEHSFGLFFIYLTRWGILLNMSVGIFGAMLVTMWHYSSDFKENVSNGKEMPAKFKVYWALHNVAVTIAIVITIVYWSFIFDDETRLDQVNIMSHVVNSVVMFVDVCTIAYPLRLYHAIHPIFFGIIYIIFTYIYYICGGLNTKGELFIYNVLQWNKPSKALTTICSILIICIVVHATLFAIHKFRVFIHRRCYAINSLSLTTNFIQMTSVCITNDKYETQGFR